MIKYFFSLINSLNLASIVPTGENRSMLPYYFFGAAGILIIVMIVLMIIKRKK